MSLISTVDSDAPRPVRADRRRNQEALLQAAAAVFAADGVEAPVREIAARAGVGTATIYRHFPTRADLIVAVYRHQVETLEAAGPVLLADSGSPYEALRRWVTEFVDFVITKQGLPAALQSDDPCYDPLHDYFVDRLVPVAGSLLSAAAARPPTNCCAASAACAPAAAIRTTTPGISWSCSSPGCAAESRADGHVFSARPPSARSARGRGQLPAGERLGKVGRARESSRSRSIPSRARSASEASWK